MPGKILVTGGAGYIGAHAVVELVNAGYEPVVLDNLSRGSLRLLQGVEKIANRAITFHEADCVVNADVEAVFDKHRDIEAVMHFAAFKSVKESVLNPSLYYRNNIDSLLTLLDVMAHFNIKKMVFSSSCTVYGQPDRIPVTEDAPFKVAESPYGATKQMCERILQDVAVADKSFQVLSLRYFNPIGAHPSGLIGELPVGVPDNLVPFITQTAIGKRENLTVFGNDYNTPDGSCLRDFIHVVDLAAAHVAAVRFMDEQENAFEAINIGSGEPASVLELIRKFERVTGVKVNYTIGQRRPGDIEKVYADPVKCMELLRWKTALTIEDALRDAWNWEKKLNIHG
jgi:UDP-glucose 4-epimerase